MPEEEIKAQEQAAADAKIKADEEAKRLEEEELKKLSPEDYKKALEEKKNLSIALKKEREELKTLKEYKAQQEAKEQEQEEKKKLEKGKHEEVINSLKKENEELKAKANAFDELKTKVENEKTEKLNTLLSWLPEDILAKYNPIAEKLELDDRLSFFEWISSDIMNKKDFSTKPEKKGTEEVSDYDVIAEKVKLKKPITPTERSIYLTWLRKKTT